MSQVLQKINDLTVRQITKVDLGLQQVAGMSFPIKTKYKMGKIQNQIEGCVKAAKEARQQVSKDAITKFSLKKEKDPEKAKTNGEYIMTVEAENYLEEEATKILDRVEDIAIYPFTLQELEDAEKHVLEWNEDIKSEEQSSQAIPNQFYQLLFPIIVDEEEAKAAKKK